MIEKRFMWAICLFTLVFSFQAVMGQGNQPTVPVVKEEDLTPAVVTALPDYRNLGDRAVYIKDMAGLKSAVGEQKVLEAISFEGGTDAATADYEAGKLVVIEFDTPQEAFEADKQVNQLLPQSPGAYYRRVGNYAVFVFNAKEEAGANSLIERVKYEKKIQWIGEDPYIDKKYQRANNEYIQSTLAMFVGSIKAVVAGMLTTLTLGVICGYLFFRRRNRKLEESQAYTDAGGMTRLNLDGLSEDRLLLKD